MLAHQAKAQEDFRAAARRLDVEGLRRGLAAGAWPSNDDFTAIILHGSGARVADGDTGECRSEDAATSHDARTVSALRVPSKRASYGRLHEAFIAALKRRCGPAVVKWLIDAGAEADYAVGGGADRRPVLSYVRRADVARLLLAAGASTWLKTDKGVILLGHVARDKPRMPADAFGVLQQAGTRQTASPGLLRCTSPPQTSRCLLCNSCWTPARMLPWFARKATRHWCPA